MKAEGANIWMSKLQSNRQRNALGKSRLLCNYPLDFVLILVEKCDMEGFQLKQPKPERAAGDLKLFADKGSNH